MARFMRNPQTAELAITNRCNLRCKYCYYFASPSDVGADLPTKEWLQFIDEMGKCSVMNVILAGGEPFCREDLPEIISRIVQNRMRFGILTNGTLITENMAKFLASTRRCDWVQVSIDGSIPTTHDACRGPGSFRKAMEGIRRLQEHEVPIRVRVTIHRDNVNDLEGIAQLLLEELGLDGFSTNSASYMGLCMQNADQVQLTPKERMRAMETLLRLDKKYKGLISAAAGPLADGKRWRAMEEARSRGAPRYGNGGFLTACSGVMSKIAVRSDGIMVPCTQMSHIELGKINADSLQEIWLNHPELRRLRERQKIPLSNFEFCKGCEYLPYCTGNCPALAYNLTGMENHPSPDACLKKFLEAGGKLPAAV
jgi:SynChlorMet cassette radical SAM/SPASM protein ScmE